MGVPDLPPIPEPTNKAISVKDKVFKPQTKRNYSDACLKSYLKKILKEETCMQPTSKALTRFQNIVKKVMNANRLLWCEGDSTENETVILSKNGNLGFNKRKFRRRYTDYHNILTESEKVALLKEPEDRNSNDLHLSKRVLDRIPWFSKYSAWMRDKLSRSMYYMRLKQGRILIKEGRPCVSFYYIASGTIQLWKTETDEFTGVVTVFPEAEICAGSCIGESALEQNEDWPHRAVTVDDITELLRIDLSIFKSILNESYERETKEKISKLKAQFYFKNFSDDKLQELSHACRRVEHKPGKLITSSEDDRQVVHLILSGTCEVIKQVTILRERYENGKEKILLLGKGRSPVTVKSLHYCWPMTGRSSPEKQLWTIAHVGDGYYFGAGEMLKGIYVVAKNTVVTLEIDHVKILQLCGSKMLEMMAETVKSIIPSDQKLLGNYMQESYWDSYKQLLCHDVIKNRKIYTKTSMRDVPESIKNNSLRSGTCQQYLQTPANLKRCL